jgi:hypothetical protein
MKTTPGQPEQLLEREETESDHEWLQLIQMEKMIETQKSKLLETRAQDHWDLDDDRETLWEAEGGPVKEEDDSLDDKDLAYINAILNSFSKTRFNHENSNGPELPIFTPEGALTCALAPIRPPPKFNKKFNQNLTSCDSSKKTSVTFQTLRKKDKPIWQTIFLTKKKTNSLDAWKLGRRGPLERKQHLEPTRLRRSGR